jgi:hypothetical protein
MTTFEKFTLVLQVIVAVAAFATLAFLYRQIRVMVDQIVATQEASRAESALAIVAFLQSSDVRTARECVRSILSTKHHSEWSDEEKTHASLVCANYDVAAGLLRARLAPTDLIVANWGPSIVHCHQVLSQYMTYVRAKPGGHAEYWTNFDWLRSQVPSDKR